MLARLALLLGCSLTLACAASTKRPGEDEAASLEGASEADGSSTGESDGSSSVADTSTSDASTSTSDTSTSDTSTSTSESTTGEPGSSLGVFDLTYYWVTYEGDFAAGAMVDIGTCGGQTIASVRQGFADALKIEGSGKLLDDRIVNIGGCGCGGGYDCFAELDPARFPWGQGSQGNPLVPYHTIATDPAVLPFGTAVYAPALVGQALPDGSVHDGCLRAGDVGGAIDGMHIDWFVGLESHYETLDPDVPETVELFEGGSSCP